MKALHLAIYDRNIGDNALNYVIDSIFKNEFEIYDIYNIFKKTLDDEKTLKFLNSYDVLIIGGGGLLSSHVPGKKVTKWGTAIRIPLEELKSKKVFYSLGYNNFYPDIVPARKLVKQLKYIIEDKDSYISLRNDESKERLKPYVDSPKIKTVPDAGTFFPIVKGEEDTIVINVAMDSPGVRYENNNALNTIYRILQPFRGDKVGFIFHTPDDSRIMNNRIFNDFLHNFKVKVFPFDNAFDKTEESWSYYGQAKFVIGTRGHTQIICAGNSIPCFSIGSHPKIEGYARHNDLLDYYCHIDGKVNSKFKEFLKKMNEYKNKCNELQRKWKSEIDSYNQRLLYEIKK